MDRESDLYWTVCCCVSKVPSSGGQSGTQDEAISKAKQSRSEKKARKALSKLGL